MNQPLLLHVVERLEGLIGKLPGGIQKPILSELTPLKELFLQQRPPRFLFAGSDTMTITDILELVFGNVSLDAPVEIYSWRDLNLPERGAISFFDARGAEDANAAQIEEELRRQKADIILFIDEGENTRGPRKIDIDNLRDCLRWNETASTQTKAIAVGALPQKGKSSARDHAGNGNEPDQRAARIRSALESDATIRDRLVDVFCFVSADDSARAGKKFMSILARELPNEARIEMIRISQDKEAQHQVAQVLVKSTTAICTAIGAQPIPLADMPILTTLQLVMVSGIMYVSGRERSLRAATEFVGALGANLGAGMLLREGARAILKFFPGWGNLVSGAVAGAGTYAIGRAAEAFFLEGVSLRDARRTYLRSRKKSPRPELPAPEREKKQRPARK
jgi:uncharacterized protein (DUF697 family)